MFSLGSDSIGFGAITQAIAMRSLGKDYHERAQALQGAQLELAEHQLQQRTQTIRIAIVVLAVVVIVVVVKLTRRKAK